MPNEARTLHFRYQYLGGHLSPVVWVRLFRNDMQVLERAYVDSGAFYSIFDIRVAERLGLDWQLGRRAWVVTAEGHRIPIFLHPVGLRIGTFHIRAEIGFSEQLGIGFNLLGRHSLFNVLQFCFNDRDGELIVSRL